MENPTIDHLNELFVYPSNPGPSAPEPGYFPHPVAVSGVLTPEAIASVDLSDLPDGPLFRLWSPNDEHLNIFRPPLYKLQDGRETEIAPLRSELIVEVIRPSKYFTFRNHMSQGAITAEEAEWLLSAHAHQLCPDDLPEWWGCDVPNCTFATKSSKTYRAHVRVYHG